MKSTKTLIIITLGTLALFAFMSSAGCSINSAKESLTFTTIVNGKPVPVEYTNEIWQGLFLYYTSTKNIEHVSDFSSLVVGQIDSKPDTESIEALSPFWATILKGI